MTTIKTKKFILRPFKKGDEASLMENINSKKVYRPTLTIPYPYTTKDAKEWIKRNQRFANKKHPESINFAIDIDGDVVGGIELSKIEGHRAEIGYWLGERYWRKGIMTEAVKVVTRFGFEKLGLRRIYAGVFPFNKASMRVLEKAGYQLEGILRKNVVKDGRLMDDYLYAKVR